MTSTNKFPDSLFIAIGDAVAGLPSLLGVKNDGADLLAKLGYKLPGNVNPAPLFAEALPVAQELGQRVKAVVDAYADGSYRDASFAPKLLALGQTLLRVAGLTQQLIQKAQTVFAAAPDFVANAHLDELPSRFEGFLIANYLWRTRPLVASVCELLGLLRQTLVVEGQYNPEYTRFEVRWEQLGKLISAPGNAFAEEYGWGSQAFDSDKLLERLKGILWLCGMRADSILSADPTDLQTKPSNDLDVPIWTGYFEDDNGALASISVGILLQRHVPAATPDDAGLALTPYVDGQASAQFPVSDDWALTLGASLGAQGLQILFHPSGVSVSANAKLTGAASARLGRAASASPLIPLGREGSTRIEIKDLSLTIGAAVLASGADFGAEAAMKGVSIVIETGEADGFLQKALGALPPISFDLSLGFSRSRGLYLGPAGLDYTVQLGKTLGPIQINTITLGITADNSGATLTASASGGLAIGPFAASVDRIGLKTRLDVTKPGALGKVDLSFGFKPPNGIGLAINATAVVGGGYLFFDTDKEQYAGVLQLEIAKTIAIKAIGLLTTRMPDGSKGFSLLVIITAEGFGPIQLGFGFTLTGIGGLLGVNRTCVVDTLRSGIKNGTVGSILFPQDPVRNAQRIVSDVGSVFPPALHRYVFGPMVKINWGTPPILTMEIGLVLEVPDPIRLLILGRLLAVLPEEKAALVRIRMDSLGVIDFGKGEISLDATLYDSRILAFVLTGDMALRANFGANPGFLLSVGGWNPAFPSPPGFPLLARMAITLSSSDNARLRLESYMAITSNTVQFGACVDLYFAVQPFSLEGYLGFDALFHFSPFSLQANLSASVTIRMNGAILMSVGLDATLTGPSPWHIWGSAHFSVLCFKQSVSFDVQYGSAPPPALPPAVDVKSLLTAALNDVRNWSSELPAGERPLVTFRAIAAGASVLSVHPLAELAVRERVVPLDMTISKFGSAPVSGENSFSLKAVRTDGTEIPSVEKITDSFALAQFEDMSDDQKLSSPSFVQETAGIRFTTGEFAFGYEPALDSSITYTTLLIVPAQPAKSLPQYTMPATVLDGTISMGAAAQAAKKRPSGLGVRAA